MPPGSPTDEGALSTRWAFVAAMAGAASAAILVSSQIQLSMAGHGHDWWRLFAWQLTGWGFWVPFAAWLLRAGERLTRHRERRLPALAREAGTAFGLTLVHFPIVATTFFVLQPYLPVDHYSFAESMILSIRSWIHIDLLIYCLGVAVGYGWTGYRQARRAELRQSRLETELARAQLETLRLQIQPHFLFNTLNSIAALIRRQSNDRAFDMVIGLSDFLRATLEKSEQARVPLSEDLDFVKRYIELQRARFADRLSCDVSVDDDCLGQPVPTLLLQPLVENAIRHGISRRAAPGRIEIRAHLEGDRLIVEVRDDGVGLPEDFEPETHEGIGLGNTRSRLRQLYGDRAGLDVGPRASGGVTVRVVLPAERSQPPSRQLAVG